MLRDLWFPIVVVVILGLWVATRFEARSAAPSETGPVHAPGVVSMGDRYHAAILLEDDASIRLYTLGRDESRVVDVPRQTLEAFVQPAGEGPARRIRLRPEPQAGDDAGRTSQFVGHLPAELVGQPIELVVPSLLIGRERFRIALATGDDHQAGMPAKVSGSAERELYLVAGGRYTQADIEANGRQTASERYRGFRARHDFNPQPGDAICPVTRTKANFDCTWIIDGREYAFCCPPCIDEFVTLAKERPEELQPPEYYEAR